MSFASKCNYLEKLFMQIQFLTACPWRFDHPGHQPHPGQDFHAWAHPQILLTVPLIVQPYCAVQRMPLCTWQHDLVDTAAQSAGLGISVSLYRMSAPRLNALMFGLVGTASLALCQGYPMVSWAKSVGDTHCLQAHSTVGVELVEIGKRQ